jgi:two-component system, LytTR family, response regulator
MTIRVAIVDDEAIARRRLMRLLSAEPDVEVVAECPTGRAAIDAIRTAGPDLVLLDVQLPDIDGFGVVAEVGAESMPPVIFVTAHDAHAVRAFEVHATDYLLKPFDTERFQTAFRRARAHIDQVSSAELGRRLKALVENQFGMTPEQSVVAAEPRPGRYVSRLTVRRDGRVVFVRVAEVDWFEAAGNYVRLHVGKNASLLRETMHGLEASLDPAAFVRIHRTIIVNVDRIQELQPWFAGNYVVILRDGTRLKLSRTYRDRLPLHGRRSR